MSIRKIWTGVLLDDLKVMGSERIFYDRVLDRMSEAEVQEIVELLESAADGTENALEKACAVFVLRGTKGAC